MRKDSIAILGLLGVLISSACSGESSSAAKDPKVAVSTDASNSATVTNTTVAERPAAVDANTSATSNNPMLPVSNSVQRKIEEMRKEDSSAPRVDPAVAAEKLAKPAPDNSTFASYLGEEGVEIRTFKSHPQLLKVEKRTAGNGTQTLKVFLKGGRVIEMPGNKINPLSTAPASLILRIANVLTEPTPPPGVTFPADQKKQQKP